jgi:predicted SAM-dependent methyltransferase
MGNHERTSGAHVDHVRNANDLSRFPDCSLDEINSSHTLEHFDYRSEMIVTLREW